MQEYEDDFFFEEDKIQMTNSDKVDSESNRNVAEEEIKSDSNTDYENTNKTTSESLLENLNQERYQLCYQNLMGMTITSGSVTILKDDTNLIGISIGGGAPLCPCLYIVQVFDNTPASKEGTLQSGDELVGVNGQTVKGKTKVEVAKMIQAAKDEVNINYNKLHADPKQGKTLDIIMKKVKHRLVENMSSSTADALGLSRAILCNDTLVKKLQELQNTELMYKGLVEHARRMLKAYFDVIQTYKNIGDVFAAIGVREPQPRASEAFSQFGAYHRQIEKDGIKMLKSIKPILADMGTYLNKAIPDTKLTIKKYADTKFEYLSYCLKVKEMDDEEYSYSALQEPLYRVETGNYEYRLILRCRQDARNRFAKLRSDVLVKIELLDSKHVQDVVWHLLRLITGLATFHNEMLQLLKNHIGLFPIEVDLTQNAFQYKSVPPVLNDGLDEEEDLAEEIGKEATEHDVNTKTNKKSDYKTKSEKNESDALLPDLEIKENMNLENITDTANLLAELGLSDIQTSHFPSSQSDLGISSHSEDDMFDVDLSAKLPRSNTTNENLLINEDLFGPFFDHSSNDFLTNNDDESNTNLLSGFN